MKHKQAGFVLSSLVVIGVFYAGFLTGSYTQTGQSGEKPTNKLWQSLVDQDKDKPNTVSFATFWEAWQVVDTNFFGAAEIDKQDRVNGAISGMLSSLKDPYTVFLPKEENDLFQTDLSGKFSGIGAEISMIDDFPTIVTPLPGSPAEKAGALPKDIIIKVDDLETEHENFAKVINHIRGEKGSTVVLKIVRQGEEEPLDLSIVRDEIELPSVKTEVRHDGDLTYGYIQINQFLEDTEPKVRSALKDFKKQNVTKMVVDVRNDPGGLLNVAIDISSLFIDPATHPEFNRVVVYQKDKEDQLTPFEVSQDPVAASEKLVILVNGGSASASEIFAGALRDYGRAQLIGQKTFGKGSVQELHDLKDGSSVKITIAKWLTPNKSEIDKVGIEPNLSVETGNNESDKQNESDLILQKALETIR